MKWCFDTKSDTRHPMGLNEKCQQASWTHRLLPLYNSALIWVGLWRIVMWQNVKMYMAALARPCKSCISCPGWYCRGEEKRPETTAATQTPEILNESLRALAQWLPPLWKWEKWCDSVILSHSMTGCKAQLGSEGVRMTAAQFKNSSYFI